MDIPNVPPNLSPAERFAFVMRGLFRVPKEELNAQLAKSAAERAKGKRKQGNEKPTR